MEANPAVFQKKLSEIKLSDYSPDKILKNVFIERKNMLTSYILLNIEEHSKLYFNIFLISFIVIAHIVLLTKRYTIDQKDKIVSVLEKGYALHDKVIRFAKVVIGE